MATLPFSLEPLDESSIFTNKPQLGQMVIRHWKIGNKLIGGL